MIKNRYYFNVNECLNGYVNNQRWKDFEFTNSGAFSGLDIEYQAWEWLDVVSGLNPDATAAKFFNEYLALKANDICFASDNETLYEGTKLNTDYKKFLCRFLIWWRDSFKRYKEVIEYYEDQEGKLMSGIVSVSKTTTDNTDINTSSAVPTSSTYQSYPSATDDVAEGSRAKAHGTIDVTTDNPTEDIIDHLDKLKAKVTNLYNEWLKSFEDRFILYIGD